jgi:hypothetical protein
VNAASKTGINVKGAKWKYPDADLLFFRFIRKCALYKGNNVSVVQGTEEHSNVERCNQ